MRTPGAAVLLRPTARRIAAAAAALDRIAEPEPGAGLALETRSDRSRAASAVTGSASPSSLPTWSPALSFLSTGSLHQAALLRGHTRRNPRQGEREPVVP